MKERQIIFSAPMVRALLADRKTQTRRIMKPQPTEYWHPEVGNYAPTCVDRHGEEYPGPDVFGASDEDEGRVCPYGKPGDRLWVRETHAIMSTDTGTVSVAYRERMPAGRTLANTDGGLDVINVSDPDAWQWANSHIDCERWRPSIFMPRWASRITLEIADVRVQRLQEISADDAEAEGLACVTKDGKLHKYGIPDMDGLPGTDDLGWPWHEWRISPVDAYQWLWESINGAGSWDVNPWVWALTFKRVQT